MIEKISLVIPIMHSMWLDYCMIDVKYFILEIFFICDIRYLEIRRYRKIYKLFFDKIKIYYMQNYIRIRLR